ncbi:hypothetical protein [Rhodococcus sp. HNM0569]|uniref:hypothetical protein n=1 Tax=Rhodococcus sp. HNM0569 TaxID=2716340 RepID=UPI00146CAEDA|nr:hypothetical protein [Rhodococcus sp. HNM0569]NLU81771.1 hypothetical protein [Rhodococcus sp. HNM0569]
MDDEIADVVERLSAAPRGGRDDRAADPLSPDVDSDDRYRDDGYFRDDRYFRPSSWLE